MVRGATPRLHFGVRILTALLLAGCLLFATAWPARAAATPYYCGVSTDSRQQFVGDPNCKYTLAKGGYDLPSGNTIFVDSHWIRGGTASGACDPSNNVYQWAIDSSRGQSDGVSAFLVNPDNGYVFWSRNRQSYRANCDSNAPEGLAVYQVDRTLSSAQRLQLRAIYWHKVSSGGGFANNVYVRF